MKRIPMNAAAEYDTLTSWRRRYVYLQRAGVAAKIKRGYRRRERATARRRIARGED